MKLKDPQEIQFRQIHPKWMESDGPSRQAFIPMRNDDGKLSLDRSATTTAEDSFNNYIGLGLCSGGVYGLTPSEFEGKPNPVECFESPLANNPHHSHADFNGLTRSQKKKKSQYLRIMAINRKMLYP